MKTPLFFGRSPAALLALDNLVKSAEGCFVIAAEVADSLGVADVDGTRILSFPYIQYNVMIIMPGVSAAPGCARLFCAACTRRGGSSAYGVVSRSNLLVSE